MTLTLAQRPDLLAHLRSHPEAVPAAIEESLRIDPPLPFLLRRSTADVSLAGVHLDAGSQVAFGLASANRDETVWDDPDTFVLDRDNAHRHMSFGDGPHICPSAALARLEARVAIETLVERVDHLELDEGFVYRKTAVPFTNGPQTLHIRLDYPSNEFD
jgi:cytochrome P450